MKLGYTKKWIDYNFLTEEALTKQVTESEKADETAEHYRYASFQAWLEGKEELTDTEINNYIELAKADADDRMSGTAIKDLFVSPKISDEQFEMIMHKLPQFGDWTQKLIARATLSRRLDNEELTSELFAMCFEYKKQFNDNRLLIDIIKKTKNVELLSLYADLNIGKKIKTMATNKMNKLLRAENNL